MLLEMRELAHILKKYTRELEKNHGFCTNTILNEVVKKVEFRYYHNEHDRHRIIRYTEELFNLDNRFDFISPGVSQEASAKFAGDAPFVRGCISIQKKQDN
jgi:hypothetical protein